MKTFEEVDAHVKGLTVVGAVDFCAVYQQVRPVLAFVADVPFFPAAWRSALAALVKVADAGCP